MVRIQALSMAIAGTVCAAAVSGITASSAQSLTITNHFRVDINESPLTGQSFFGSFTYDDAALNDSDLVLLVPDPPPAGLEFLTPGNQIVNRSNGLTNFSFNFLGKHYDQSSDAFFTEDNFNSPSFLAFPQVNFREGQLLGLDFFVSENPANPNPVDIPDSTLVGSILAFGFTYDFAKNSPIFFVTTGTPEARQGFTAPVTYGVEPIPTPALLPDLVGMGVAFLKERKREAA